MIVLYSVFFRSAHLNTSLFYYLISDLHICKILAKDIGPAWGGGVKQM